MADALVTTSYQPDQPTFRIEPNGRHPVGNSEGLTQAYILRNLSALQAKELSEAPASDFKDRIARAQGFCALVKAWAEAADRIRIMRGKPLPGSLRPERKPARKKPVSLAPTEEPINPAQASDKPNPS